MSIQHANRGVVKKDLQLYYNREFLKSFRGEPTTNLVFGDYDSFENDVSTYYPANATAVRSTAFSYFGNYSLKASRSSTGADAMLDMESIIPVTGSTVYTYSCYVYVESMPAGVSLNVLRPVQYGSDIGYITENGGGAITQADVGKWKRVTHTFTTQSNTFFVVCRINFAGIDTVGTTYYIDGRQLEQKSYATPFVRSYQLKNNDIVPRREKDINWFKSYGTSGFGSAADNSVGFSLNGDGTFIRLGYGQTFGDYTIKPDDIVYKYNLGVNGCHYHGNTVNIKQGEYAVFTCDYYISPDAVDPGVNGNSGFILVAENYASNAPSGGYGVNVPDLTKGVWRTTTLFVGPAGAASPVNTIAAFLYPGGCGSRFATSGYLLMKNPTLTINTLKKPVAFKYPGNSFTANLANVTQAVYGESRFTKNTVGASWNNARVYSTEGYTGPCYVSFYPSQNNLGLMIALNSDPASGIDYSYLDYAWYGDSTGIAYIFENGSNVFTAGAYTLANFFEIIYDGNYVHYYMDGVLKRSTKRTATTALYLDSSFYTDGAQVYNLAFGPYVTNTVNDGAGLIDLTGNTYNINTVNTTYNDSTGFKFDGSNFISLRQTTIPASSFTVFVWLYPTSVTSFRNVLDCNFFYNASGTSSGNIGPRLEMNSSAQLGWVYSSSTTDNDSFYSHTVLNAGLTTSTWHCVAITYDSYSNTSNTYYNGNRTTFQRTAYGSPSGFIGSMTDIVIGKGFWLDGTRTFVGSISNLMIYSRALTDSEIQQNFQSTRKTYGV